MVCDFAHFFTTIDFFLFVFGFLVSLSHQVTDYVNSKRLNDELISMIAPSKVKHFIMFNILLAKMKNEYKTKIKQNKT